MAPVESVSAPMFMANIIPSTKLSVMAKHHNAASKDLGDVFKSPDKKFKYHNFIGIVDKEFETNPDWETERTEWMTLDELRALKNKHFGLESLLDNFDFDKLKPKNE